jgi:hypothetical protein
MGSGVWVSRDSRERQPRDEALGTVPTWEVPSNGPRVHYAPLDGFFFPFFHGFSSVPPFRLSEYPQVSNHSVLACLLSSQIIGA